MPPPPKPGIQAKEGGARRRPLTPPLPGSRGRSPPRPQYPRTTRTLTSARGQTPVRRHPPGQGTPRWVIPPAPLHTAHLLCLLTPSALPKPPRTSPAFTKHKSLTTTPTCGLPWDSPIPSINLELARASSKQKPGDWYSSPLSKQSPTHRRVGDHCADTQFLVRPQNISIKIMIADEMKRGLGYIFVVENLVAPLLALLGATSTEAAMKHWLVTCSKPNMVGPFLVQCPDFLLEEIGTIQKFRAQPSARFVEGKVVQLNETEPTIRFKVSKASEAEMRQVRPTARKPVGSWLTIKVSAEATADQGACKHGLGIALKYAGFTLSKIAFQRKSAFKVAVNVLHCDVQSVPPNGTFDFTSALDFHIKTDGIFKPHTAIFERLAPELFVRCELKPCKHHTSFNCLCNLKSTRKTWTKGPPKDSAAAERELLAKARAQQEAEDSACKLLPQAYIPIYSYTWDHTLGYEGEGHPLHLVSLNVNGVLSNDTWARAT